MKTDKRYIHRQNEDGTVDSICMHCFRTVATAKAIENLAEAQRNHHCEDLFIFFRNEDNDKDKDLKQAG
jgi:hypothetical protein